MSVDYYSYIQSEEWRQRANAAKHRAGHRCQVCNRPSRDVTLDAHHRTYERLGNEDPDDITVLCRNCHELYETSRKMKQKVGNSFALPQNAPPIISTTSDKLYTPDWDIEDAEDVEHAEEDIENEEGIYEDNAVEVYEDVTFDETKHFWLLLGKIMYGFGYIGNAACLIWIEWSIIYNEPWQLLNPYLQTRLLGNLISTPLFWQLVAITVMGITLTYIAQWTGEKFRPSQSMLRWYWAWKGTALVKVPIFLIVMTIGIWSTTTILFMIVAFITAGPTNPLTSNFYLLPLTILRSYIYFLPVPLLHFIWDNGFKNNWAKFAVSICALVVIGSISVAIDYLWGRQMCLMELMYSWQCNSYLGY